MADQVQFDPHATCDRCGHFGAYLFEEDKLCTDCYAMRCSCCPEFGADDLAADAMASDRHPQPSPHTKQAPTR